VKKPAERLVVCPAIFNFKAGIRERIMITIDLTMPIQIANMLILIVIMNIVLYRPIRTILAEREKRISGLEKDVDEFNKNAKLRLEEFDARSEEHTSELQSRGLISYAVCSLK